ncbi:MAG: VOC family protein [Gemmatimonadota bacterium]|nr:VOC family protein [Gemmatimonadota bacterium]
MKAITPYLNFDGNCREAMTFYQTCLGGELQLTTLGEMDPSSPPEVRNRLMHARLVSASTILMASDTMPGMPSFNPGDNVWLSLNCDTDDEVNTLYPLLSKGGKAVMEPHDAPWNARFGMFTDQFGVHWMLHYERAAQQA